MESGSVEAGHDITSHMLVGCRSKAEVGCHWRVDGRAWALTATSIVAHGLLASYGPSHACAGLQIQLYPLPPRGQVASDQAVLAHFVGHRWRLVLV